MKQNTPIKWYDRKGVVILLLTFLFPVGIFALIKNRSFSNPIKYVLGIGFTLFFGYAISTDTEDIEIQSNDLIAESLDKDGDNTAIVSNVSNEFIEGLMPVDIYQSCEENGFTIEKKFSNENGNTWKCKKDYAGINYEVLIYSSKIDKVESVSGTAIINGNKKVESLKSFIKFVASLPYDNSDISKAQNWVESNFNVDKASINIGDAQFTIYAPSNKVRMIRINKIR